MSEITWTGAIDGDLSNADNWSAGVPTSEDSAVIPVEATRSPSSGTCVATSVFATKSINGGTFSGIVSVVDAFINDGVFNGPVMVSGSAVSIMAGVFNNTVSSGFPAPVINGGTFNGVVTWDGNIFYATFTNKLIVYSHAELYSCTFNCELVVQNPMWASNIITGMKKISVLGFSASNGGINSSGIIGMV